MNKLLVFLLLLNTNTIFCWTYKFDNRTSVKVRVKLGTIAGPDYSVDINPNEIGTISTGGWCRRSINIVALEKDTKLLGAPVQLAPFHGDFACTLFMGTNCCSDHSYSITQSIGTEGIMGPRLDFNW